MYENIATRLQLTPRELQRASLRAFLNQKLRLVESQLFTLKQKYGVSSMCQLDQRVREGELHEAEVFEDYMLFDHLEAQRDDLIESLGEIE